MDEKTRKYYRESRKREKYYYYRKAVTLVYGEAFMESLKYVPKMSVVGVLKLIPAIVASQISAMLMDFSYYVYLLIRSIRHDKALDSYWNGVIDSWNGALDAFLDSAIVYDKAIEIELTIRKSILKDAK